MLTSIDQGRFAQPTVPLYPSVSLQPTGPQLLPSAPQLSPIQFQPNQPQLTPIYPQLTQPTPSRAQPPLENIASRVRQEAREIKPQVNRALDRVGQEAQGFARWFFGPLRS